VRDKISHPSKTKSKIIVLNTLIFTFLGRQEEKYSEVNGSKGMGQQKLQMLCRNILSLSLKLKSKPRKQPGRSSQDIVLFPWLTVLP
jgi:hypothetical protein